MKVLEKGNWENPWSMEMNCSEKSCGAKLLVEEVDVKPVDYGSDFYAECMVCGQHISILKNSLPLRLAKAAEKGRKYRSSSAWD